MSKVVAAEYLTLDGVMESPAWTAPYFNDELGELQRELAMGEIQDLGSLKYAGFEGPDGNTRTLQELAGRRNADSSAD